MDAGGSVLLTQSCIRCFWKSHLNYF